ncbi:MAG: class II aldolase/adducin family protein [Anaerolineae bacterium]
MRDQICEIGQLMRQYNYIDGTSGNISARLDDDHILCTPSGLAKGRMVRDQLIVVNMDGKKVGEPTYANADLHPTSEILMHLECYRQRPDVNGVVHAHPPTAVALTAAGISLERPLLAEVVIMLGLVPTAPYATPCGTEDRDSIRELIADHDAVMLSHHGSLTVGADLWTAYLRLEVLEHFAEVLFKAQQLGGVRALAAERRRPAGAAASLRLQPAEGRGVVPGILRSGRSGLITTVHVMGNQKGTG